MQELRVFFLLGLPDPERERGVAVLAVVVVAEDLVRLARAVEAVRRRERRNRSALHVGGDQAIAAPHRRGIPVGRTAKALVLPAAGEVAPDDARGGLDRQPLEPAVVLEGDRLHVGLGNHHLANQVGSLEHVVLQPAGEDAQLDARKTDLEAPAVALHLAALRLERRRCALHFFRLPRQAGLVGDAFHRRNRPLVGRRQLTAAFDVQRRVPERFPLDLVDHLRRELDAELHERLGLLLRRAPQAGHDAKLRRHVGRERRPLAALLPERQLLDRRRAAAQREAEPQLLAVVAVPDQGERVVSDGGRESGGRLVTGQIALQRIREDR